MAAITKLMPHIGPNFNVAYAPFGDREYGLKGWSTRYLYQFYGDPSETSAYGNVAPIFKGDTTKGENLLTAPERYNWGGFKGSPYFYSSYFSSGKSLKISGLLVLISEDVGGTKSIVMQVGVNVDGTYTQLAEGVSFSVTRLEQYTVKFDVIMTSTVILDDFDTRLYMNAFGEYSITNKTAGGLGSVVPIINASLPSSFYTDLGVVNYYADPNITVTPVVTYDTTAIDDMSLCYLTIQELS